MLRKWTYGQYVHRQGIQICDLNVYNVAIRSAVTTSGFIPPTSATTIASNNNIVLLGCQSNTDIELASGEFKGGMTNQYYHLKHLLIMGTGALILMVQMII